MPRPSAEPAETFSVFEAPRTPVVIEDECPEHIRIPDEIRDDVVAGRRTAAEIQAIHDAGLQRSAMAAQQQAMTQQQMNAMVGAMNQEMALLLGSSDPLAGGPTTPYWKRMYGELGQAGGPYYPKKSGK